MIGEPLSHCPMYWVLGSIKHKHSMQQLGMVHYGMTGRGHSAAVAVNWSCCTCCGTFCVAAVVPPPGCCGWLAVVVVSVVK